MRPRKLTKLWFQFGGLCPDLDADQICAALEGAGLIERIEDGTRYIETTLMRTLDRSKFESVIRGVLTNYKVGHDAQLSRAKHTRRKFGGSNE